MAIPKQLYYTLREKQDLFRILRMKGVSGDDAKTRIENIVKKQKEIAKEMLSKDKTMEEIKEKQQKMIREMWSY